MALDPTARESNVRDSIKKYFVDNINNTENIPVTFDKALSTPNITGDKSIGKWLNILIGPMERGTLSTVDIEIFCCTRKDFEGFKLAQLCDTVMGYLSDTDSSDGFKKIPFYRSRASGAWTLIGGLVVQEVKETGQLEAPDETKFKILTTTLRFASKI